MSVSNREYHEKRDFIRMRIDSPVEVLIAGEAEPRIGICRDLSGGGMLIEVDTTLPTDTEVEVTLASNHGHAPMLRATAIVTRISAQSSAEGEANRIGLRIKDIIG